MREKRVSERSIKQISRKKILPRNNCQNDSSELTNLSSSKDFVEFSINRRLELYECFTVSEVP